MYKIFSRQSNLVIDRSVIELNNEELSVLRKFSLKRSSNQKKVLVKRESRF